MAQEGTEKTLNLQEAGHLTTGGMMSETVDKRETVVFGTTRCLTETVSRSESVIITNV